MNIHLCHIWRSECAIIDGQFFRLGTLVHRVTPDSLAVVTGSPPMIKDSFSHTQTGISAWPGIICSPKMERPHIISPYANLNSYILHNIFHKSFTDKISLSIGSTSLT